MKISQDSKPLGKVKAELMVVVVDQETSLHSVDDSELSRLLEGVVGGFQKERLKGEYFHHFQKGHTPRALLVYSTASMKSHNLWENVKTLAARSLGVAASYGFGSIAFVLNHKEGSAYVGKAVEGFCLGAYRFDKYKKSKSGDKDPSIRIVTRSADASESKRRIERYRVVSEAVNFARDLVNEPGDQVYPHRLAQTAKKMAAQRGLSCTVLDEKQLRKQGYTGLNAVGKGSVYPPRLIVLKYRPKKRTKKHLALVGKGITFDTGGISIKPSSGMWTMKGDMAGGAAVIGAMSAIATLQPKTAVTGIVAAAENFPGPHAQRPGDIFVAKNGKSVMVDNTDAEGRLVLTDALARAGEEKATHIVDAATLTGSVVRALGTAVAGIMGNDSNLVQAVIDSGVNHGEAFWELPLVEEYKDLLKTPYADLNNIGGANAGAITAGLFLQEFVPEGAAWVHLDIAGPFILERKWKYYSEGATGFGVKTMVDLAERFHEIKKS